MELKTFAEDDFDPKKWINKAWNSSSNQEKEVFVTNTVTRLQLYMKQLTNSLDETTTQRVTSIPRILQDASALQLEGSLLFQKLLSLEQKVESVEEQTGHSIESLQKIDTLKTRLENAASALREADKWAALANSLEDILESGVPTQADKLTELSQQVAAMTTSLEVLSDAPDYEAKRLQMETLYNRLEAAVTPPLLEALTKMDAERSGLYVRVFAGMSRSQSCARAGLRAAGARLASAWRSHPHHSHRALSRLLAAEAPAQVDWLINVMKSEKPMSELIRLYTDLLMSLEPSPSKVVSANLKLCSTPDEGVTMLTDLRSDIDDFVTSIKNIMNAPKQNKETIPHAVIVEFGRAAYLPLKELLPKYTESQTQMLTANVKEPSSSQDDLIEYSRTILSMTERCKSWLSTAYSSAVKIAGKAVYPYYIPAVEALLSKLSTYIASHSRHIESKFLSTVTNGQPAGVLSTAFPAALVLESAAKTLLDTVAERQNIESSEDDDQNVDPLLDLPNLLLDPETRQRLSSLRSETLAPVLGLRRVKEQLRNLSRAILRSPIDSQLDKIPQLSVWNNNDALSTDLPDFSLSPQEYITEIGQYLMTLPQHLEMHLTDKQAPLQFLSEVCNHTCEVYAEKILNIRNMDALGTKRCLTDIVYLSSVVEDLGTSLTPSLKKLEKSLRAAAPAQNE